MKKVIEYGLPIVMVFGVVLAANYVFFKYMYTSNIAAPKAPANPPATS